MNEPAFRILAESVGGKKEPERDAVSAAAAALERARIIHKAVGGSE